MLKNYTIIALRNIYKYKIHALINIVGLALAIAFCLLLVLFIQHELSYDAFHENADLIFRINATFTRENSSQVQATTPAPLGPAMKKEFPEVELSARFLFPAYNIKYRNKIFTERVTFTDPDFLKMFSFRLLQGNPDQILKDENTIVISQDLARKYFAENNPIGEHLTLIRLGKYYDFTVNGVIENAPDNSSIQYDILVSFEELRDFFGDDYFSNWGLFSVRTYVQLYTAYPVSKLDLMISKLAKKHDNESDIVYHLQSLTDVHFAATILETMTPTSSIIYSYILASITVLILLIASFNSMNFTMALSSMRYREVGVRKVLGATRRQILIQFCTESTLIAALACLAGVFIAELFLPVFNGLANKTLSLGDINLSFFSGLTVVLIGSLGLFSGLFPALLLTKFKPSDLYLQRSIFGGISHFSRLLITIQFGLSIFLIVCAFTMSNQLNFIKTKNLGFNSEQIVVIPFHGSHSQQTLDSYRAELQKYPGIVNVSGAISYPGSNFNSAKVMSEGHDLSSIFIKVDYDFIKTFGITLGQGRDFSRSIASDTTKAIIINEAFAKRMGWASALGKKAVIEWMGWEVEVIGVMKDFHYTSLHEKIGPLLFFLDPFVPLDYFFVKIKPERISKTLDILKEKWHEVAFEDPFYYFFLDKKFDQLTNSEKRWRTIIAYSALLALFIACFGLFGFSSLLMTKRTKEIGIRKVVGASINSIILMLSKELVKWVIFANIIAWPLAWYVMNRWLENFSYKLELSFWTFLFAGTIVLVIAFLTLSSQAIKIAVENPVNSLRYE